MSPAPRPVEGVLDAALRLLAPRRRGVEELRGRLQARGFDAPEVARCLAWLEERGLLDDKAFSEAMVRDRLRFSPRSLSRIRQELGRKGIASPVAAEAVETVAAEDGLSEERLAAEAARAWARKQGVVPLTILLGERFRPERERARRRLYAFLARRGFRGDAARAGMDAGIHEARKIISHKD